MFEAKYRVLAIQKEYSLISLTLYEEERTDPGSTVGPSGLVTPSLKAIPTTIATDSMEPEEAMPSEEETFRKVDLDPIPETEEELIVKKMLDSFEKYIPGVKDRVKQQMQQQIQPPETYPHRLYTPPSNMMLKLTEKQYEALGAPQFNQVITLKLEITNDER